MYGKVEKVEKVVSQQIFIRRNIFKSSNYLIFKSTHWHIDTLTHWHIDTLIRARGSSGKPGWRTKGANGLVTDDPADVRRGAPKNNFIMRAYKINSYLYEK